MGWVDAFFRGGVKGCMPSRQSGDDPGANLVTNRKISRVADKAISEKGKITELLPRSRINFPPHAKGPLKMNFPGKTNPKV